MRVFFNRVRYVLTLIFIVVFLPITAINKFKTKVYQPNPVQTPLLDTVAVTTNNNIRISWTKQNSANIAFYNVYRISNSANAYGLKKDLLVRIDYRNQPVFMDMNTSPCMQTYKYEVAAVDNCGREYLSYNMINSIKLLSKISDKNRIELSWNKSVDFEVKKYRIYKGFSSRSLNLIDSVSALDSTYIDTFDMTKEYFYKVEAIGIIQDKNFSQSISSQSNLINKYTCESSNIQDELKIIILNAPANPYIDVFFNNPDKVRFIISIFDFSGRQIRIGETNESKISIEKGGLQHGIYILRFAQNGRFYSKKFII